MGRVQELRVPSRRGSRIESRAAGGTLRRTLYDPGTQCLKRGMDVVIAALVLIPALPLMALAILVVDGRPVFYAQKRRGMNGGVISILKLRTMYRDSDIRPKRHLDQDDDARAEWGRFFKLRRDPRILPVIGAFLRRAASTNCPNS